MEAHTESRHLAITFDESGYAARYRTDTEIRTHVVIGILHGPEDRDM